MELHEIADFIRPLPFLAKWPERDIQWLASRIEVVPLKAGEQIFDVNAPGDDAYIVFSGRVRQYLADDQGRVWWFQTLEPGRAFIQERLFHGKGRATDVVTEEASVLLAVRAAVLSEALIKHPELWRVIQQDSVYRLQGIPLLRNLDDNQIATLAITVVTQDFNPGDTIGRLDDEEGMLWIIDRGQVRIEQEGSVVLSGSGVTGVSPTNATASGQDTPALLTAGNFFATGSLALWQLPGLQTITAVAVTKVKTLAIASEIIGGLADLVPDIAAQLRERFNLQDRLKQCLQGDSLFAGLSDEHWRQLGNITGWQHVPSGLDVVRQGEYGTKLFALADGSSLVRSRDDQERERPQHVISRGVNDYFGTRPLLYGDRYAWTVRSMKDVASTGQPIDGSDWLTIQRDDLQYLISVSRSLWEETNLARTLLKGVENKEFSWLEQEEDVVYFSRRHVIWLWLRVILSFMVAYGFLGLMAIISALFPITFNGFDYILVMLAVLIPLLTWYIIDYYNDYYVITNRRVARRDRVLFLMENRAEAQLERVQDIALRTDLMAKIFNYGYLTVSTAALVGGKIAFDMVPEPTHVEEVIKNLQRAMRATQSAEDREALRNRMLSRLQVRLIPKYPPRVLPDDMQPPVYETPLAKLMKLIFDPFRRFFRWIWLLPEKIYFAALFLLPRHVREDYRKERLETRKRKEQLKQEQVVYRKHPWFLIRAAAVPIISILIVLGVLVFTELAFATCRGSGSRCRRLDRRMHFLALVSL